jgi:hypothetical protein
VPKRQLQYWSTAKSRWLTATGARTLYISSDERTNVLQAGITVR